MMSSAVFTLHVTSENAAAEKRFERNMTTGKAKERLEVMTGCPLGTMKVELYNRQDQLVAVLGDDSMPLNMYPIDDYYRLHVIDTDPYRVKNEFTDVSQVEKYEMADHEYDKRTDSVRNYLQRNKLGKYADKPEVEQYDYKKEAEAIAVGQRCEVELGEDGLKRRGEVKFVGMVNFKPGYWVGVEYDEPLGKHDGMIHGERYFQTRKNHGALLRPDKVTVGDFPEEDFSDLEEL